MGVLVREEFLPYHEMAYLYTKAMPFRKSLPLGLWDSLTGLELAELRRWEYDVTECSGRSFICRDDDLLEKGAIAAAD